MTDYKQLTNEELLAERERIDDPDDPRLDELDSIIFRRTGAADGDITNDYFACCIERKRQAEEIQQLKLALQNLLNVGMFVAAVGKLYTEDLINSPEEAALSPDEFIEFEEAWIKAKDLLRKLEKNN